MNTYFSYGYEVPQKGEQYLVDRINEKENEKQRMWTSEVKRIKKADKGVYIVYTCNSRYIIVYLKQNMQTYFGYGYELPQKREQYLIDRINEKENEKQRMWTSIVKKTKKIEEDIYILYTCNSRYIVRLLR